MSYRLVLLVVNNIIDFFSLFGLHFTNTVKRSVICNATLIYRSQSLMRAFMYRISSSWPLEVCVCIHNYTDHDIVLQKNMHC